MSNFLDIREGMAYEEKSAWIYGIVAIGVYARYVRIILDRAGGGPLDAVPYGSALLWTVGASIAASIVLHIILGIFSPKQAGKRDERDEAINRFGERTGQSFVVISALAALIFALLELEYFWIANVIYLCFTLSAVLSAIAKIIAYRRGFQH
ncbi:MAG TPA: hypothetical protein VFD39_11825 [Trueperaceae bacterium]|nr:hypothetical protein [Trueperaceae bacterium]